MTEKKELLKKQLQLEENKLIEFIDNIGDKDEEKIKKKKEEIKKQIEEEFKLLYNQINNTKMEKSELKTLDEKDVSQFIEHYKKPKGITKIKKILHETNKNYEEAMEKLGLND